MVEYCNFIWYNLRMTPAGRQLGSLFPAEKTASEREVSQEAKVSARFTWPSWPPLALGDDAADSLTGVGSSAVKMVPLYHPHSPGVPVGSLCGVPWDKWPVLVRELAGA